MPRGIKFDTDFYNRCLSRFTWVKYQNVALAEKLLAHDDAVDIYFEQMKSRIIDLIAKNPSDGEFALDLLTISKYFEHIGDHATNIAEWVIYSVIGIRKGEEK